MRIEVTRGGDPTDEELAAVVLALTPVAVPEGGTSSPPAWARAALLEGVGSRQAVSADDLAALQRGAGRIMTSNGGS